MEPTETIQTLVKTIVDLMVPDATVEVVQEDSLYKVFIQAGDNAPAIIGRHGDTIRSLQKILEVACYQKMGSRIDLVVNVNDYREKQIERLQNIAAVITDKVRLENRGIPFRGLNSYERRIVHEYITKNHTDLTTYSVGEGKFRELMIDLQSNAPSAYNAPDATDSSSTIG